MKQYQHPESHQIIHYIADRIRPSDISFSFFNEPHIYISDPKKIVFKEKSTKRFRPASLFFGR